MSATNSMTTSERLARAIELGRRMAAVRAEPALWRLNRAAWLRRTLELAGWHDLVKLEAARDRLRPLVNLTHELEVRATLWAADQPEPAIYRLDADRFPAAASELLFSGMSGEQASAVACMMVAELRDQTGYAWGRADAIGDDGDGERALAPYAVELVVLDRQLSTMHSNAFKFDRDGRPVLEHDGFEVPFLRDTAGRFASCFAELAALHVDRAPSPTTAAAA